MKMLKEIKLAAVLAALMLAPVSVHAKADLNLKDILNPATAQLGVKTGDKTQEDLFLAAAKKASREIEEQATLNKEELKLRDQVGSLHEENEGRKENDSLIAKISEMGNEAVRSANARMKALFKRAGSSGGPGISSSDVDKSDIGGMCAKDVNLSLIKQVDDKRFTETMDTFRRRGTKAISESEKSVAQAEQKALFAQIAKIEEEMRKERGAEEAQPDMLAGGLDHLDLNKPEGLTADKRIERLKADKDRLTAELDEGFAQQIKALKKLFTAMFDAKNDKSKEKMEDAQAMHVEGLVKHQKELLDAALSADTKQYENCKLVAQEMGRDQPGSSSSKIFKTAQVVANYYSTIGVAATEAQKFFTGLSAEAAKLQCKSNKADIEAKLGRSLEARIRTLSDVKDPVAFLEGALGMQSDIGTASAAVAKSIKKPMRECKKIEDLMAKMETFTGNVQQAQESAAGQQPQGFAGAARRTPVQPTAPAHFGQQPQRI